MDDHQDGEDGEDEWRAAVGHTEDDLLALSVEELNALEFSAGPDDVGLSADNAQVEVDLVETSISLSTSCRRRLPFTKP